MRRARRIVRLIGTNQDVTEARQAEQERQRLLARLYEVLEGQHQRLAVDLHDGHVQSLAAVGLKLDQVQLRLGAQVAAPVRELLDQLRGDLSGEVAALRRTIGALRPLVLDQCGLATAVHDLAHATRSRSALVDCAVTDRLGGERLTPTWRPPCSGSPSRRWPTSSSTPPPGTCGSCWNGRGRR